MSAARKSLLLLLGLDLLAVLVVFNAVTYLRALLHLGSLGAGPHLLLSPLLAPYAVLVVAIYLIDGYRARTDMMSLDYTSMHAIALLSATVAALVLTYVVIPAGYELQYSRAVIALSYVALIPLTLSYRRFLHLRLVNARGERCFVYLGDRASCLAFQREWEQVHVTPRIICCVTGDDRIDAPQPANAPELRSLQGVLQDIAAGVISVEAVVLRETNRELESDLVRRLVELYFAGLPTYTLEMFHQVYWRKIPIYRLNQTWLFQEGFTIAREPVFERIKRMGDLVAASLGLVIASPVIVLAAIAVWLDDRGPCIFAQTRVGRNHAPFRLYKLRTMRAAPGGDRYTQENDQRITRVGKFLRASRIDELPQLFNVLRGEMSMIGPRAEWDQLVAEYEREIPCYFFRHLVKPGITGWAQVNYPYGASLADTVRKLEYDLYYIRHFSFRLDASIVLKTIHVMLFGKGR
ncbi:MAG: exopolysaccharide biosynthesis polyprenyl glycosylphosphotransferase [Verrucomicrobia bacterium]|nr:exopolysaccharide biosynthesis polyprenyl glycosylphosphotransferase [Verrucomicrobiota bacterium]